jgi:membrane-bound lytic murein transglycosylase B
VYLPFSIDVKQGGAASAAAAAAAAPAASAPPSAPPATGGVSSSDIIYQDAIDFDPDLNKLQASLLREGFSPTTVKQMIVEVSRGKKTQQQDAEKIRVQKERLHERLAKYQLKEKSVIPAFVFNSRNFPELSSSLHRLLIDSMRL